MTERLRELLALDLTEIDVRHGLLGTGAVVAALVLVLMFGFIGEIAALAALFVIARDTPRRPRERIVGVVVVTVIGAAIGFGAVLVGVEHVLLTSLLSFAVTAAATLVSGILRAVHGLRRVAVERGRDTTVYGPRRAARTVRPSASPAIDTCQRSPGVREARRGLVTRLTCAPAPWYPDRMQTDTGGYSHSQNRGR